MRTLERKCDVCVVGGGLAGLCAVVGAARHGAKVVLMHDRPVLGGNASSEIRMWICGAHGKDNRETGIVEELELENYYRNPKASFSIWDTVLYECAIKERNLTLLLNTSCFDAKTEDGKITEITGWQSNAETFHKVVAKTYIDCSGDSILAPLSGARFRYGREAKAEFGESIPPDAADRKTMGMSCLFQIREYDRPVKFTAPDWAYVYETEDDLPYKDHELDSNWWWIEIGGEWDAIHDTDRCREELLKIAYGVWDHVKNRGDHGAENFGLDWVGFLPGKRESRRYVGLTTITQNDVEAGGNYPDTVAYAGWTMDDHFPAGFYYTAGYPTIFHPAPSPWGIPLRALISENIGNLCFAGRNISVTHTALSSSRVMATCAILGQAIGTASALASAKDVAVRDVNIDLLRKTLADDDCFLPGYVRTPSELSRRAVCTAPVVLDGIDRGEEHLWIGGEGDSIAYTLKVPERVEKVRLIFDSDLNRGGLLEHNMPQRFLLKDELRVPETLVRDFDLRVETPDGKVTVLPIRDNRHRFVEIPVGLPAARVTLVPLSTWGAPDFRVFNFEIM